MNKAYVVWGLRFDNWDDFYAILSMFGYTEDVVLTQGEKIKETLYFVDSYHSPIFGEEYYAINLKSQWTAPDELPIDIVPPTQEEKDIFMRWVDTEIKLPIIGVKELDNIVYEYTYDLEFKNYLAFD